MVDTDVSMLTVLCCIMPVVDSLFVTVVTDMTVLDEEDMAKEMVENFEVLEESIIVVL